MEMGFEPAPLQLDNIATNQSCNHNWLQLDLVAIYSDQRGTGSSPISQIISGDSLLVILHISILQTSALLYMISGTG